MSQTVSVRELRDHLSEYLNAVEEGETLLVTSRQRLVARIIAAKAPPPGVPEIPGVHWAKDRPSLSRPLADCPAIEGEAIANWIVTNRR